MQRRSKRVGPYCRSQFSTLFLVLSVYSTANINNTYLLLCRSDEAEWRPLKRRIFLYSGRFWPLRLKIEKAFLTVKGAQKAHGCLISTYLVCLSICHLSPFLWSKQIHSMSWCTWDFVTKSTLWTVNDVTGKDPEWYLQLLWGHFTWKDPSKAVKFWVVFPGEIAPQKL